jgi:S1-C subfamily serine protease
MKRSTAILAVVSLSLAAFAVARLMSQPLDSGEDAQLPPLQRPTWGWIGCRLGEIDEGLARQLNLDSADGVLIVEAMPNSPGLLGGLRDNDVVRKMDNEVIRSTDDLRTVVRTTKPGQVMKFTVTRDGREVVVPVTLGTRPVPPVPKPPELPN